MRIKTFEASTIQEALALAKNELGQGAVVLNTKHVRAAGIRGLRGGGKVEVLAAVDDDIPSAPSQHDPTFSPSPEGVRADRSQMAPVATVQPTPSPPAGVHPERSRRKGWGEGDPEISQLRSEVRSLAVAVRSALATREVPIADKPLLVRLGVDEDVAQEMLADLLPLEDPGALASALAAKMQTFACPPVLETRQVIAVVGPTGVGKTTTLAKLAARFSLEQGKKVALVTADAFRIGAVEQLRTYARIMGLPLETALSPEDAAVGVGKHQDKDVVLIDTVGRSQRSEEHIGELKAFVDAAEPTETHLVVAASLGSEVQREVVERFAVFSPSRLIITKLDESLHCGSLANLPLRTGLGISCLTAGQNVPQDIEFADSGRIGRLIAGVA